MKKVLILLQLILLLLMSSTAVFSDEYDFDIESTHVILINMNEDSVLYEKDPDSIISIASLTKIMTAIVAVEKIEDIHAKTVISSADLAGLIEANASVAGFLVGEEVTYEDLLYGLLLPSGADAAQALARATYGSVKVFVSMMNQKAAELGMEHTHFANTTGLDHEENYSTINDVVKMFRYALDNEILKEIMDTEIYKTSDGKLTLYSILRRKYLYDCAYIVGGKTGSTYAAGLCMASYAYYNGVYYMLVSSGAPYNRENPWAFIDAAKIYGYFMDNYAYHNIVDYSDVLLTLPVKYGREDSIDFYAREHLDVYLPNSYDKGELIYEYHGKDTVKVSDRVGDYFGSMDIFYEGEKMITVDLYLQEKAHFSLWKFLKGNALWIVAISLGAVIIYQRKKKSEV